MEREPAVGRTRAQRRGVKGRHDRPAGVLHESQDRAEVTGRRLVADGMAEQPVLVLHVHEVVAEGVAGDVGPEFGHVAGGVGAPTVGLQRIDVAADVQGVERPHEVATVRGDAAGDVPRRQVQDAHRQRSSIRLRLRAASGRAVRKGRGK